MALSGEGIQPLVDLIERARRAVPSVRYALGVAGVGAAGAILGLLFGNVRSAVVAVVLTFGAMVLMVVFSRVAVGSNRQIALAASVMIWAVSLSFAAFLFLLLSAVAIGWPRGIAELLLPSSSMNKSEIAMNIALGKLDNPKPMFDQIVRIANSDPNEIPDLIKIIKPIFDRNVDYERSIRKLAVDTLNVMTDGRFDKNVTNEFVSSDLASVDFSRSWLSGVDFENAFLVLTNFKMAQMRDANLKDTSLRGANFSSADLSGSDLTGADWFNAFDLTIEQLRLAKGTFRQCPDGYRTDIKVFRTYLNQNYVFQYEGFSTGQKEKLTLHWAAYSAPGQHCDFVAQQNRPSSARPSSDVLASAPLKKPQVAVADEDAAQISNAAGQAGTWLRELGGFPLGSDARLILDDKRTRRDAIKAARDGVEVSHHIGLPKVEQILYRLKDKKVDDIYLVSRIFGVKADQRRSFSEDDVLRDCRREASDIEIDLMRSTAETSTVLTTAPTNFSGPGEAVVTPGRSFQFNDGRIEIWTVKDQETVVAARFPDGSPRGVTSYPACRVVVRIYHRP